MRPLSEMTNTIIDYYKQGKKASEIRELLPLQPNGKKMTIQGVSNAINRYKERELNGNGKPKAPIVKKESVPKISNVYHEDIEKNILEFENTNSISNQFTNREIELLEIGIDAHIKAYRPKAKSGASKLTIRDFEELLKKIIKLKNGVD